MPVERRDGEGNREVGPSWESLAERQIRDAIDAGAFEDLPHQGRPLPRDDDALAGEWAMAHRMLREAGFAPPWIEADKEVRALLAERDRILARATAVPKAGRARMHRELDRIVAAANLAIGRLNAEAPTDRQYRRPLDPAAESRSLERAIRGDAGW
jgi:Domain of unknown function (DUF1992)